MVVLAVKLLLAPMLVAGATMAGRRGGPAAVGWAAALPVVGGPVLLALTCQHGNRFAAQAATTADLGLMSLVVFACCYSRLARFLQWPGTLLLSWLGFGAVTLMLAERPISAIVGVATVVVCSVVSLRLTGCPLSCPASYRVTSDRLLMRMVLVDIVVVTTTAISGMAGPRVSGLLATFPVAGSVLFVFTQAQQGSLATQQYASAFIRGLPAFAAFTTVYAVLVARSGIVVAAVASLAMSFVVMLALTRLHALRGARLAL
jgi:hypothetical protein